MDIWSIEEIISLLKEQAGMRSMENDEGGVLARTAEYLEKNIKELHELEGIA